MSASRVPGGTAGRVLAVGFGNFVAVSRIVAVISPDSAPVRRLMTEAREKGLLIDTTFGRKTRAVVVCDSGQVVLSGLTPETLSYRLAE